ncbi:DNA mismatch repair endonuclease MutL [Parvicella tangerina]|uniref:DNA mismatch repair protein MutL n=1 Tax=Parvicella tangerina TaxID=2829795 RepID=A0A916JKH9_9FLAO|nr:DNA mismatch repair endonuclease MutL [Parvicella tangerina]CAG5079413.1 DNA mismatch repair protein MutL [Parvicella tangerina]
MPDIVKLLSDNIANQIAAGEVVQRPASAIKELLENAIDSGASKVDVVIKDAGKTLMQVIDNGCGMTETDARMAFERHATSKIATSDDLFNIRTKGFRGEALASIAAVAQVELKTRQHDVELGNKLKIEGSKVIEQDHISCPVGSNFMVKNLFFNVPARRNFLKSNAVETRHIIDEIERVALAHPDVHFTFHNNGSEVFNLPPGNHRQRIVGIFGKRYNERLVPIQEETTIVNLSGYVIKPEFCKRTRGEQFFFVNNRFIKNHYLNNAVKRAYDQLLNKDQYASYFIFMELDPKTIDINIHPTKTEVKFEDDKSMYAIINSAVRNSLGKFNIAPTIDFNQENSFNVPPIPKNKVIVEPQVKVDPTFNPFKEDGSSSGGQRSSSSGGGNSFRIRQSAQQIEANLEMLSNANADAEQLKMSDNISDESNLERNSTGKVMYGAEKTSQLHGKYILTQVRSSLIIIDQHRAHCQVLFERFKSMMEQGEVMTQRLLFPQMVELDSSDYGVMMDLLPEVKKLGFDMESLGKNTITINGVPVGMKEDDLGKVVEGFIEQCKDNASLVTKEKDQMAWNLAKSGSIKRGKLLSLEEMNMLIDELFGCASSEYDFKGNKIVVRMEESEIDEKFA